MTSMPFVPLRLRSLTQGSGTGSAEHSSTSLLVPSLPLYHLKVSSRLGAFLNSDPSILNESTRCVSNAGESVIEICVWHVAGHTPATPAAGTSWTTTGLQA